MRCHSEGGMRWRKTSDSVPRLIPLYSVSISTSSAPGGGRVSASSAPCAAPVTQNAVADAPVTGAARTGPGGWQRGPASYMQ